MGLWYFKYDAGIVHLTLLRALGMSRAVVQQFHNVVRFLWSSARCNDTIVISALKQHEPLEFVENSHHFVVPWRILLWRFYNWRVRYFRWLVFVVHAYVHVVLLCVSV